MYRKRDKIISLYCSDLKGRFYLREIAKLTRLPLRTVQRTLSYLEKEGVMRPVREGKNKYYSLNLQNVKTKFYLLSAEIYRTLVFLDRYPVFKTFLKEPIDACLAVFGSFAEFKATKTSDLDLLVVADKKLSLPSHLLPYSVHEISLTERQFTKALRRHEPVVKEAVKNHIVLTKHSYFVEALWRHYGAA
jgi:DNA-binding transcriptional ArsR family regulator